MPEKELIESATQWLQQKVAVEKVAEQMKVVRKQLKSAESVLIEEMRAAQVEEVKVGDKRIVRGRSVSVK